MRPTPTRREICVLISLCLMILVVYEFDLSLTSVQGLQGLRRLGIGMNNGGKSMVDSDAKSVDRGRWGVDSAAGVADSQLNWGGQRVPQSVIVAHVPGWTIVDKLYVLNGTVYLVSDDPRSIPEVRMMTSSGYHVFNGPEQVALREPSDKDMRVINTTEAARLFGTTATRVEGVTFLVNDPPQFITHYYHFVAELLFGLWRTYSSLDTSIPPTGHTILPPPRRLVFIHTPSTKWRDYASMNQYVLRGAFPSMSLEFSDDWEDRASMPFKPFVYDRVVFADRAAAMRGKNFIVTSRSASEAFTLPASPQWWSTIRTNVVEFSGLKKESGSGTRHTPVLTYISRQEWGRRMLRKEDHESLVAALEKLRDTHGYELNIVSMDKLTREEQIKLAGRTTIMMGIHGNGLTSLLWMQPTRRATVIEFFYPGGFAYDYEFTSRAIGITHYGFWGAQSFTSPDVPPVAYPEGFQGNEIPLDGEAVAALIQHRLSLDEELDD